jgi:anti-anti-sigma factor
VTGRSAGQTGGVAHDVLTIEERPARGEELVLALAGELDASTAPRLVAAIDQALARRRVRVVLDLRDIELLDSTGLSALLDGRRRCARAGSGLVLVLDDGGAARRLLRRLNIEELFDVRDEAPASPPGPAARRATVVDSG